MRKKICFVVAVPGTAQSFLRDHMNALSEKYDIYLMGNITESDSIYVQDLPLTGIIKIDIRRGISLWNDLKAVFQARKIFKQYTFDAVHSVTPKAGLVCALAGKLAGVKHRTHIFTGQVWATRTGLMRRLLKFMDIVIVACNNHILVDGKSQRKFLVKEGVLKNGHAEVFCHGSIAGVNSERFVPSVDDRTAIRKEIGIKDNQTVFIFLGRFNHDKGIGEIYEAYNRIAGERQDVFLLFVGYDEEGYLTKLHEYDNIKEGLNFHFYGATRTPGRVLNAGDVYVLPTWREGFGTSVLEAACIGLPCICSDAYGVLDAYVDGETGLRCHVGDANSLYSCMVEMANNPELRKKMGENARTRALRDFNVKPISEAWLQFYNKLLD